MIVIIDYGMGNLRSVQKAIEAVGSAALITSDPDQVRQAAKVILPGVGAFADAIAELKRTGDECVYLDMTHLGRGFVALLQKVFFVHGSFSFHC